MASGPGQLSGDSYNRDVINSTSKDESNEPPRVIKLSNFLTDLSPAQAIQQTADYARHPRIYLESLLGNKVLADREKLLCIPDTVDRDIYGDGEHKRHFEQHIAALFGKEHGLFFLTGTQAQVAAMRIHADRAGRRKTAWHITSHLESAEESAYKELYGLDRIVLGSDPGNLATIDEVKDILALPEEERPAAIQIEIPNRSLGCQTYSYSDLEAISSACREAGVKFHMDGARFWEVEPYYRQNYGKSFADIGSLFDSLYVSFYKGLRGYTGAVLVGPDAAFIETAKIWQRRAGGQAYQLTYEVLDSERGYNENIGTFDSKWRKMEEVAKEVTAATSQYKHDEGQAIVEFWPKEATCCQIRTAFRGFTKDELDVARDSVLEKLNILIFSRMAKDPRQREKKIDEGSTNVGQNGDKLTKAEVPKTEEAVGDDDDGKQFMIEWMIVETTLNLDTKVFVDAYVLLCEELLAAQKRRLG